MTHRLYYTDSYLRDFNASITAHSDGGKRVYLDRTAFYPASGGQPSDTGQLGGIEVLDVVEEGNQVAHLLAAPPSGSPVVGRVDWPRRFNHMQQHTGQHLLSAVAAELLGRRTIAVHFGKETSTVDLDGGPISEEQVVQLEERANAVVTENRPVSVVFEDATLAQGLRKPSEREGSLRIVTIQGLDRSACGGTHVSATGEIGAIAIRRIERMRTGMRLEFTCGGRTVRRARSDYDVLSRLAGEFTAAPAELPQLIKGIRTELKEARAAHQELQHELDLYRARELYAATVPDGAGIRRILRRQPSGSVDRLRGLGQALASMPRAVFVGATGQPPAVVLAASQDVGIDAARILRGLLIPMGGRGGGSSSLAQGVLPRSDQLEEVIASLVGSRVGQ